jgi:hypothetical protein
MDRKTAVVALLGLRLKVWRGHVTVIIYAPRGENKRMEEFCDPLALVLAIETRIITQ